VDRESYTTHDASGNGFTLATVRVVEDDFEEVVCVCVKSAENEGLSVSL